MLMCRLPANLVSIIIEQVFAYAVQRQALLLRIRVFSVPVFMVATTIPEQCAPLPATTVRPEPVAHYESKLDCLWCDRMIHIGPGVVYASRGYNILMKEPGGDEC
jgi:hypothetical protein